MASGETFAERLAFGQIGERQMEEWLLRRGALIIPIGKNDPTPYKGPRVREQDDELISPDILAATQGKPEWYEVKTKTHFTWRRLTGCWETGIDLDKFKHYLRVQERSKWPVWLVFLHKSSTPSNGDLAAGCPPVCPVGLFGQLVEELARSISHKCEPNEIFTEGGVFWHHDDLIFLATLEEFSQAGGAEMAERSSGDMPLGDGWD